MKKIISLLIAVACAFSITSCGIGSKNAVWDGYDKMPFAEFLKEGLNALYSASGVERDIEVSTKNGWSDSDELGEEDLSANSKAVTYIVNIGGSEDGNMKVFFFMELEKNTLTVVGAKWDYGSGVISNEDAYSAEAALGELITALDNQ